MMPVVFAEIIVIIIIVIAIIMMIMIIIVSTRYHQESEKHVSGVSSGYDMLPGKGLEQQHQAGDHANQYEQCHHGA